MENLRTHVRHAVAEDVPSDDGATGRGDSPHGQRSSNGEPPHKIRRRHGSKIMSIIRSLTTSSKYTGVHVESSLCRQAYRPRPPSLQSDVGSLGGQQSSGDASYSDRRGPSDSDDGRGRVPVTVEKPCGQGRLFDTVPRQPAIGRSHGGSPR